MLTGFLTQMNVFLDRRFILAFWTPVFITVSLLALGGTAVHQGPNQALETWAGLDPVMQVIVGLAGLLGLTVLAYGLQALTTPIVRVYSGYWPSRLSWIEQRAKRDQEAAWQELRQRAAGEGAIGGLHQPGDLREFVFGYPRNKELICATRLGNTLAAAEEYPFQVYALDSVLWWPRLIPLLPESFRGQVDDALTPMLALINLSFLLTLTAFLGGLGLLACDVFVSSQPIWLFVLVFAGGLLLARFCYEGAVAQAVEYGNLIRVAFDLYRGEILKQMHIPVPDNSADEGRLWHSLNQWVYLFERPWNTGVQPGPEFPDETTFYYDNYSPPAKPVSDKPHQVVVTVRGSPTLGLRHEEGLHNE